MNNYDPVISGVQEEVGGHLTQSEGKSATLRLEEDKEGVR